jgi:hypothetical protein
MTPSKLRRRLRLERLRHLKNGGSVIPSLCLAAPRRSWQLQDEAGSSRTKPTSLRGPDDNVDQGSCRQFASRSAIRASRVPERSGNRRH